MAKRPRNAAQVADSRSEKASGLPLDGFPNYPAAPNREVSTDELRALSRALTSFVRALRGKVFVTHVADRAYLLEQAIGPLRLPRAGMANEGTPAGTLGVLSELQRTFESLLSRWHWRGVVGRPGCGLPSVLTKVEIDPETLARLDRLEAALGTLTEDIGLVGRPEVSADWITCSCAQMQRAFNFSKARTEIVIRRAKTDNDIREGERLTRRTIRVIPFDEGKRSRLLAAIEDTKVHRKHKPGRKRQSRRPGR